MKTTTIVNQKGGVCKTTICRNLGYLLATTYKKKVLLVDLDSSGNLSDFFGQKRDSKERIGAPEVLSDMDADPNDHIFETRVKGLYIMPGNASLGTVERLIKAETTPPPSRRLRAQLEKVEDQFDYCLIDCPPTVSDDMMVLNALAFCDNVIVPCPATIDAVNGVGAISSMLPGIRKWHDNPNVEILGVLFCRISRKALDRELLNQQLSVPRFKAYVREASALAEYSRAECKAFAEYDANAKGTHDMANVAAEYLGEPYPYPDDMKL